jgi:hypothetical protein
MEYLDLWKLKRYCRPDANEMDEIEIEIIHEILLKFLIIDVDICSISDALSKGGYITAQVSRNIDRVIGTKLYQGELKVTKRVTNYLTNKISFVALLWALSASGYQRIANLLLASLERARLSSVSLPIKKASVLKSKETHLLVKQLKLISDSKTFDNPVAFIRRLAIRFKETFALEQNDKRKKADRYFAILAVELDNSTFMTNKFVSVRSLVSELRRVLPFTSNSTMNEALINGRIAEIKAISGEVNEAVSMMQDLVPVIYITEACPETGNMYYMTLNILLQTFERNPTADMKQHFIEMGYNGLHFIRVLDVDIMNYWNVCYTLKIIFCVLGLSISGRPLCLSVEANMLQTAQYFLSEIKDVVNVYGIRKVMCYKLAIGRLLHLQGHQRKAAEYLKEARALAMQGEFIELKSIDEYHKSILVAGK